ncbi:uncharacterized protein L201_001110 [Kwoniella dendrophila CBS 6074]|uniref:F-box domain-containing protein n=1 Tax=Kwoniella dendrophila CBS 6074 TaxID=1295534 RepID=A0AAX4JLE9_9TREE
MIDLTPASSSSSLSSSTKRHLSPVLEDDIPHKKIYTGTSMVDILSSTHPISSRGQYGPIRPEDAGFEKDKGRPIKDKGKGKMKMIYLPELPEEVWTRIFEIYYEDRTNEWQSTGVLREGLTPVLICRDLARTALPVLYRHPYIGYKAISSFVTALTSPRRYNDLCNRDYIKHITIRASPIIPTTEFSAFYAVRKTPADRNTRIAPYTIHPLFERLMRSLPELATFTLKDTLVLHQADATQLFYGLSVINPKKVRLEFRMWDLYDSPFGQDIIGATKGGAYTSYGSKPAILPSVDHFSPRNLQNELGCIAIQKTWRDALYNATELDLPSWWIEPMSRQDQNNAPVHPAQAMILGQQHVHHAPGHANPFAHNSGNQFNPFTVLSSASSATPQNPNPSNNQSQFSQIHNPVLPPPNTSDSSLSQTSAGNQAQSAHLRRLLNDLRRISSRSSTQHLSMQLDSTTPNHPPISANTTGSSQITYPRSGNISGNSHGHSIYLSDNEDLSDSESELTEDASIDSHSVSEPSNSSRQPLTQASASLSTASSSAQITPATRLRDALLEIRTLRETSSRAIHSSQQATVPPPRHDRVTTTVSAVQRHHQAQDNCHTPHQGGQSATQAGPDGIPLTTSPGLTSYSLAHHMRSLLLDLIREHWTPRLQALSIVALDPLASLIVRSPQLDLWTQIAVPHIRVHLPRSINSLAVFKGPKEVARDRARRRREMEELSVDPQGDDAGVILAGNGLVTINGIPLPSILPDQENDNHPYRIVGGEGAGNELVNQEVRLFELEINSMEEMRDDVWIKSGDQLPPQLCRILAGEHDWRDVSFAHSNDTYSPPYSEYIPPDSPATSDFASPTFSFASFGSDDLPGIDEEMGIDESDTYDRSKAEEQAQRMKNRTSGSGAL